MLVQIFSIEFTIKRLQKFNSNAIIIFVYFLFIPERAILINFFIHMQIKLFVANISRSLTLEKEIVSLFIIIIIIILN